MPSTRAHRLPASTTSGPYRRAGAVSRPVRRRHRSTRESCVAVADDSARLPRMPRVGAGYRAATTVGASAPRNPPTARASVRTRFTSTRSSRRIDRHAHRSRLRAPDCQPLQGRRHRLEGVDPIAVSGWTRQGLEERDQPHAFVGADVEDRYAPRVPRACVYATLHAGFAVDPDAVRGLAATEHVQAPSEPPSRLFSSVQGLSPSPGTAYPRLSVSEDWDVTCHE